MNSPKSTNRTDIVNDSVAWLYNDVVHDHFLNPRNFMDNEEQFGADGVGMQGSPACGDMMKIWIKIDGNKIIGLKWQTFGCPSAIASTSMMSEMITENGGMTIQKAKRLKPEQVVDRLGGLPKRKFHCSVLGHHSLRAAIEDYERKKLQ